MLIKLIADQHVNITKNKQNVDQLIGFTGGH